MGEAGRTLRLRLGALLVVPLVAAVLGLAVTAGPVAAAKQDRAEAVIAAALQYLGRPYRLGGEGPATLDCSGLIFRAFSDANQLKAVGGARMRAVGYLRWFDRRALATTDETLAERGDLIVYADGEHIGIYLGRGEVVSALTDTGITVHRMHGINWSFSHVLKVDWSMGKNPPVLPADEDGGDGEVEDEAEGDGERDGDDAAEGGSGEDGIVGLATGSLNLRSGADPASEVVGIVSRGSDFTVVDAARSPTGSLWLNVTTGTGQSGWIWSQFTQLPDGTDVEALADGEEEADEALGVATGSLNLRSEADPDADIVGWVSSGESFRILGGAHSPGGWLWLNVETETGVTGWIWSAFTDFPSELVQPDAADAAAEATEGDEASEGDDPAGDGAADEQGAGGDGEADRGGEGDSETGSETQATEDLDADDTSAVGGAAENDSQHTLE